MGGTKGVYAKGLAYKCVKNHCSHLCKHMTTPTSYSICSDLVNIMCHMLGPRYKEKTGASSVLKKI